MRVFRMAPPPSMGNNPAVTLTRRKWMLSSALGVAAAGLTPRRALAAPPRPASLELDLPQLRYSGEWNPRPGAMKELGAELRLRTRLAPLREPSVVTADAESLFATPFLYVAGTGEFPPLGADAESRLRRFVDFGGMLVFDDASGGADPGFRNDVAALIGRVLPGSELAAMGENHVLFRSFYIVQEPMGRTRADPKVHAVQEEGRVKAIFVPNDLGGALSRGADGLFRHSCVPGGEVQREWAMRFAINILLYATCTDYKSDPAHVQSLLYSRRWK